jgi:dCMP deaminase
MGIAKVVYMYSYAEYKGLPFDEGLEFLKKFGVEVFKYDKEVIFEDPLI